MESHPKNPEFRNNPENFNPSFQDGSRFSELFWKKKPYLVAKLTQSQSLKINIHNISFKSLYETAHHSDYFTVQHIFTIILMNIPSFESFY